MDFQDCLESEGLDQRTGRSDRHRDSSETVLRLSWDCPETVLRLSWDCHETSLTSDVKQYTVYNRLFLLLLNKCFLYAIKWQFTPMQWQDLELDIHGSAMVTNCFKRLECWLMSWPGVTSECPPKFTDSKFNIHDVSARCEARPQRRPPH